MSSGASRSHDSSFHSRDQEEQVEPKDPTSQLDTGFVPLIESAQTQNYRSGFQDQTTAWSFNSPASALNSSPESAQAFSTVLQSPQDSTLSLGSASGLPSDILNSDTPLSGQGGQLSFEGVNCKEQLTDDQGSGLGISPCPMSVASEPYFAGPMQPNSQQYVWANRPFQPLQSPPGHLNQQFPPPQPYSSAGYPVGYSGQASSALSNYHQELPAPSSYIPTGSGSAQKQNESRSPSIPRPFPSHSTAGAIPDQSIMTSSPPYNMMSQHPYYLPDAPPVPSSRQSSISSHTSSMLHEPIYSPNSVNTTSSKEQQLHVMSSRPRPQCWDHGCNGREFSTFSNLLRHQREKSGVVAKAECPVCGAVFTRTTARNIHVAQGKCKGSGQESSAD
ncbi:hypothetical protein PENSTE_c005G08885 [Penicillium steckii]|uniref:C2H2-type domain-containing protein n=1 Tax=Penicillium steckii TaxID=303698 RepID=A0A1V6TJJ3_9EURO|nr:hypothetical protein PENSTE_c005G08885 [Penicillium steckii]